MKIITDINKIVNEPFVYLGSKLDTEVISEYFKAGFLKILKEFKTTHFEGHSGIDVLIVNRKVFEDIKLDIIYNKESVFVFCDNTELIEEAKVFFNDNEEQLTVAMVVRTIINGLISKDITRLNLFEDELLQLETEIIDNNEMNVVKQLHEYKIDLLALNRYYQTLSDSIEDLAENYNGFFNKDELNSFYLLFGRIERLSNFTSHLLDYATQVREAYQNQLDIRLNETMKLLTVITSIFMPLTLIVGWYGMNLIMPETSFAYSYPIVIVVSVVVVVLMLVYFKRKGWFK